MTNVAVLPPVKNGLHAALLNLTVFKNFSTNDLIAMARALPGGTKVRIGGLVGNERHPSDYPRKQRTKKEVGSATGNRTRV